MNRTLSPAFTSTQKVSILFMPSKEWGASGQQHQLQLGGIGPADQMKRRPTSTTAEGRPCQRRLEANASVTMD